MKRFVWRLQRVLDIKREEEKIKRAELLRITEKLAQTRGELLMQRRILKNIIDGITKEHPKRRLGKQEFFLRCSATNNELIRQLEDKVSKLETQQKEKITEVLKAKRFKKSLEKLRAEAKTQFIKEQEKLEQRESDEMTAVSFARKMMRQEEIGSSASRGFTDG